MKKQYDFSKAVKGKFFRPVEELEIPIYLDKEVVDLLRRGRRRQSTDLSRAVNRILRKELTRQGTTRGSR